MWKNGDKVVALNSWDGSQYNKGVGARSLCYPPNQDIIYDKGEVFTVDMYMDSPGKVCFKERRRGFTYNPANFTLLVGEAPIPVGTRVLIADRGHTYSTYSAWKGHELVEKRMGEGAVKWKSHTFELGIDVNNLEGVVIEWEKHSRDKDMLYAVMLDGTQEYIVIGEDGLTALDAATEKKEVKAEAPFFLKHVDSAQFKHSANLIEKGSLLSFHNKVHGTSFRVGKQLTITPAKGWKATINNLFGKEIFKPTQEYKLVVGTRNVILDAPEKEGFHGSESFRFDVAKQLEPHLGDGVSVYGEIAGFANGKPIMAVHSSAALKDKAFTAKFGKDITYKYGCNEAEMRWHIYRITITTADGTTTDLTDAQVKEWAKQRGFIATLDVAPPVVYDGDVRDLQDKVEKLTEGGSDGTGADWIDPSHPTEGIIIRVDNGGMTPKFYKSKSYAFRVMEGIAEAVDLEDMS